MQEKKELDIGISKFAREKVIDHLKYSFSHDFLEEADFEKRLKIVMNTNNRNDLTTVIEDLPEVKEEKKTEQDLSPALNINRGEIKAKSKILCVLGETNRKGVWKPTKKIEVLTVLGESNIDFTQAAIPPGITEIEMKCVLGETNIIVPPGVNIDNQCISILGSVNDKSVQVDNPQNPTLRLTGKVVLGSLQIKPPKVGLMKRILKKLGLD